MFATWLAVFFVCGCENVTNHYTVGGAVSGLSGTVTLQNNGGNDLALAVDGSFTFSTELADGATYAVTILTQPSGQTCTVSNGDGTINGADITNIGVACAGSRKIIFITSSATSGNLGGVTGADEFCMNDDNYPGSGTYSALIVDSENRVACTTADCSTGGSTEHRDWVLHADTTYVRPDGETIIGTTNSDYIFSFDLENSFFDSETTSIWTGLSSDWTSSSTDCTGWTTNSDEKTGMLGAVGKTNSQAISDAPNQCSKDVFYLACVEQ